VLGLTQSTNYTFRISAVNYAGVVTAVTTVDANTGASVDLGQGIIGEYRETSPGETYNRNTVSNKTPVGIRVDPNINFGDLNAQIGGTNLTDTNEYTVRWEGLLKVPGVNDGSTGVFTFQVQSDDGERLYVNGVKVTDFWTADRGFPTLPGDTGVITLKHGTEVPIVFEMNEGGGGAGAIIRVQADAEPTPIPSTVIPASFFHAKVDLPAAATAGTASNQTPVSVQLNWTDNALNEARYRIEQAVETSPGVFGAFTTAQFVTPVFDNTTDPNNPVGTGAGTTVVSGLTPGKNYRFRIIAMNFAGDAAPLVVNAATTVGGPGVIAQYFNSPVATNNEPYFYNRTTGLPLAPNLLRIDPNIDTDWGTGTPDPVINGDNFMSRYSGKITITNPGVYTFRVNSDDASYAWINGRLVSQYPGGHGAGNASTDFPITLAAGTYPLIYEQAEGGGGAAARLNYVGPDQTTIGPVPTSVLTASADLPAAATGLAGTAGPTTMALTWNDVALNEYMAHVEFKKTSDSTWTSVDPLDVVNNPNSAPAAQSFTVTGLVPGTSYDFRIVDTNFAGDGISTVLTKTTQVVPPGTITPKPIVVATGDHNLTTEGNLDWIHFGYPATATKSHSKGGVTGPQLAPYTVIGGATVTGYTTTGDTFTWTDAAGGAVTTTDITNPGDPITGIPDNGNGPNEDVTKAIDNNTTTKYLHFSKLNTGFIVTPTSGASVIGGISLTSANDAAERDPATYAVYGSNDGGVTFTLISSGNVGFTSRAQERIINFPRAASKSYTTYKVLFPTVSNATAANSMQIAEVKLLAAAAPENAAATADAVSTTGDGKGFHLDLPASHLLRRARLYLGVDGGSGDLKLLMSDGSVLPATQVNIVDDNASGPKLFVYEVDYASGLDGQTLGVDWTANGGGKVILSAVTWIDFVAPAAPTAVTATAVSKGKVNISWTDNATNETGYLVERSTTLNGTYVTAGIAPADTNVFIDSGRAVNTQYFYRVSAVNAAATVLQTGPAVSVTTKNIIQSGLRARYWNDEAPTIHGLQNLHDADLTRRDDIVNQEYGDGTAVGQYQGGSPAPGIINGDNFSSVWDGTYIADYTGAYTFLTGTDDGGRLFIDLSGNGLFEYDAAAADAALTTPNGELVVNSWVDQGSNANGDGVTNGRGIVVNLVAAPRTRSGSISSSTAAERAHTCTPRHPANCRPPSRRRT